jgi:hypothetical protein
LISVHKIVNIPVNMIASHSGHYRDTQIRHRRKLCSATVRCDKGRHRSATDLRDLLRRDMYSSATRPRKQPERVFQEREYPRLLYPLSASSIVAANEPLPDTGRRHGAVRGHSEMRAPLITRPYCQQVGGNLR